MTAPDQRAPDRRWPRSVYGVGSEPDPRFTFANERTFLAWIRTGLGFVAGGVAVAALGTLGTPLGLEFRIASLLIGCGLACGPTAFVRWARNERALRLEQPLPSTRLVPLLPIGLVIVAVISIAAAVAGLAQHRARTPTGWPTSAPGWPGSEPAWRGWRPAWS